MSEVVRIGLGLWSGQHGDPRDAVRIAEDVRAVTVTCVLDEPGASPDAARAGLARAQYAYEDIQRGRPVYAGLVSDPAAPDPAAPNLAQGLALGDVDRYVQVRGGVDEVVAGLRAVLASLASWAHVHLVVRLLFAEPDAGPARERVATFGRLVLPRLR